VYVGCGGCRCGIRGDGGGYCYRCVIGGGGYGGWVGGGVL
jgi:hypothetical protein